MTYTYDYVECHVDKWVRLLAEFKGQPAGFLEIGSFEGRSAVWFLDNILTHDEAWIMCVDPFTPDEHFDFDYELNFDENTGPYGDKVVKLKGRSKDILPALPQEYFDLIYIDGSHIVLDVFYDSILSWPLLKQGGLMMWDDYQRDIEGEEVHRAVDPFLELHPHTLLDMGLQVVVRK